jgi:NAD(P)-dependent dehydrogenase (short-subunit alcohol dehydrogenase family)
MIQFLHGDARSLQDPLGRVIVLIGASKGDGRELAILLAERGARLVLAARSDDLLQEVAALCEFVGGAAVGVQADVRQRDCIEKLARRGLAEFGRIDAWVSTVPPEAWLKSPAFDQHETRAARPSPRDH